MTMKKIKDTAPVSRADYERPLRRAVEELQAAGGRNDRIAEALRYLVVEVRQS